MSAPRTKRQFAGAAADPSQRQITSFFSPRSSTDPAPAPSQPTLQPALPARVQSDLLSVGMRVRKSVPEGYKTKSASAFKLWTDNSTSSPAPMRPTSMASSRSVSRELLPFCGINRVGGLDTQPSFELDDEDEDVPPLDSLPGLTMSQESAQTDDGFDTSRKRILHDDDDVDDQPNSFNGGSSSPALSPAVWGNGRLMAVPRSRVPKTAAFKGNGQENMAMDGDFDDADFLVFEGRDSEEVMMD